MSQEDFYKKNCTIVKEYRNIYEECKDYDIMTLNIRKAKYNSAKMFPTFAGGGYLIE